MPVLRKRNHWHGLALECLAGLEPASLRYATQRDTSYTIGTISRDCGLSVDSWRVYSTLSTFASLRLYNTTLFGRKTCKVSKKKRGNRSACIVILHSSAFSLSILL